MEFIDLRTAATLIQEEESAIARWVKEGKILNHAGKRSRTLVYKNSLLDFYQRQRREDQIVHSNPIVPPLREQRSKVNKSQKIRLHRFKGIFGFLFFVIASFLALQAWVYHLI